LSSAFILSGGATLYTPYTVAYYAPGINLGDGTATQIANWVESGTGWTLVLIGNVLITLMHAPRRMAIVATVAYGLAILARLESMALMGLPRRYHYYYLQESHFRVNLFALI
jgi:hypothetical protein